MFYDIQFIYFDLDDTLMDFSNASMQAFNRLMIHYDLPNDKQCFEVYQSGNHQTWLEFEQNLISSHELRSLRFERFLASMNWVDKADALEMNAMYISFLINESNLLTGAMPLLNFFKDKIPMGILTNGLKEAQRPRLLKTGISHFFDHIIVSDEIGISKPNQEIFELAKQTLGNIPSENILLVGDNPFSDIEGAQKFGFKTIWFNSKQNEIPQKIQPTMTVSKLEDIIPSFLLHPNI
jgi:YjjG family noncanonical pyrimidine nucleotidase